MANLQPLRAPMPPSYPDHEGGTSLLVVAGLAAVLVVVFAVVWGVAMWSWLGMQ